MASLPNPKTVAYAEWLSPANSGAGHRFLWPANADDEKRSSAPPDPWNRLGDYASIGVPEVWVVSPEGRTVEILYLEDGYLRSAQVLREGVLKPKNFPAVQMPVVGIWPD